MTTPETTYDMGWYLESSVVGPEVNNRYLNKRFSPKIGQFRSCRWGPGQHISSPLPWQKAKPLSWQNGAIYYVAPPQPIREYAGYYVDTSMKKAEVGNGYMNLTSNDGTRAKIGTTSPESYERGSLSGAPAIANAKYIETHESESSGILSPASGPRESTNAMLVPGPVQPNKSASCPNWPKIAPDFWPTGRERVKDLVRKHGPIKTWYAARFVSPPASSLPTPSFVLRQRHTGSTTSACSEISSTEPSEASSTKTSLPASFLDGYEA